MPELIDRQAALEIAMSYCPDDDGSCSKAGHDIREMLDEIEALPTIETEVLMIKSDAIRSLTDEETAIFEEWLNHDAAIEPEVRRGHWVLTRDEQYEYCHCSECGYDTGENWMIGSEIPYCSQCGSKNYDGGAESG